MQAEGELKLFSIMLLAILHYQWEGNMYNNADLVG